MCAILQHNGRAGKNTMYSCTIEGKMADICTNNFDEKSVAC